MIWLFINLAVKETFFLPKAVLEMEPFQAWWGDGWIFCIKISLPFKQEISVAGTAVDQFSPVLNNLQ